MKASATEMIECVGRIARVNCDSCDWSRRVSYAGASCGMHVALTTLAHNLQIAAGLCRAFDLGVESCFTYCEHWYGSDGWKPGCGCEAPR